MKLPKLLPFLIILSLAFSAGWTPAKSPPADQAPGGWITDPNVQQGAGPQPVHAELFNVASFAASPETAQPASDTAAHSIGLAVSQEEYARLKEQAADGNGSSGPRDSNLQLDPATLEAPGDSLAPSAPLGPIDSFPGPTKAAAGGWTPPDSSLAVGPDAVVACVNSAFVGYSKTGTQLFSIPYSSWWSSTQRGGYTFIFDPVCKYDRLSNRFIMVALVQNLSPLFSRYLVSVSTNSSVSLWWNYAFDATLDGATPTSFWADFPDVGVDNNAIYITSNQFNTSDVFQYSKIRILNKAALYAGTTPAWHDFWGMTNPVIGGVAFTLRAAHNLEPNEMEYFTNSLFGSGSNLSVYRIITPLTTPTFQSSGTSTPVTAYAIAPNSAQLGSASLIDTGDTRLLNAVMQDGYLWTAHTISDGGSPARACFRWYQLNAVFATAVQQGTFCSTGSYFYPALTLDKQGNLGVTFAYSGSTVYPTMRFNGRLTTDPPNTLQGSTGVVSGLGPHTSGRWGDYGGAALDPNGARMWFIHEFAGNATTTDWGTQIFSAIYLQPFGNVLVMNGGAWNTYDFTTGDYTGGVWTGTAAGCTPALIDYDGDGVKEFSQLCGGAWHFYNKDGTYNKGIWVGSFPGSIPLPGDYNGDGKDEPVLFSAGAWHFFDFATGTYNAAASKWTGTGTGCVPAPLDYNGDGKLKFSLFCGGPWHFYNSDGSYNKGIWVGGSTSNIPAPADYNSDGIEEAVVFANGAWNFFDFPSASYNASASKYTGLPEAAAKPAPIDYNSDGVLDFTLYANGTWYFYNASGTINKYIMTGSPAAAVPMTRRYLP